MRALMKNIISPNSGLIMYLRSYICIFIARAYLIITNKIGAFIIYDNTAGADRLTCIATKSQLATPIVQLNITRITHVAYQFSIVAIYTTQWHDM